MSNDGHIIKPLVSICCLSYNHASFIRQSFEGMLMQQGVDFEILVHDDCSTDGTTDIVREYAAKYPNIIFPLYEDVNQYQNGKAGEIDFFNYKRARGKYIAYCEGDDYWTDPLKLQKQVAFMENHPDYSVCFHETTVFNTISNQYQPASQYSKEGDFDITPDSFLNSKERIGQPLSMVFRSDMYDYEWQKHYCRYCDTMEIFHLLRVGKGRFMRFVGGQYNLQNGGVSSTKSDLNRSRENCDDFKEMWLYTHDSAAMAKWYDTLLWHLDLCKRNGLKCEYWKTALLAVRGNAKLGLKVLYKAVRRRLPSFHK